MTKADIIKEIQERTNLNRNVIKIVVDNFMDVVKDNMVEEKTFI